MASRSHSPLFTRAGFPNAVLGFRRSRPMLATLLEDELRPRADVDRTFEQARLAGS